MNNRGSRAGVFFPPMEEIKKCLSCTKAECDNCMRKNVRSKRVRVSEEEKIKRAHQYVQREKTAKEIAEELGCSQRAVIRWGEKLRKGEWGRQNGTKN